MTSNFKTWALLTILSLLLIFLGHAIGDRQGVLWGLVISLGVNSFIYFYGDQRILKRFRATEIEGQDPWGLSHSIKKITTKARIPAPTLMLIKDISPQAFAVGRNMDNACIVFTEGLLNKLNENEREAALAYLCCTIKRQDTLAYTVACLFCDFFLSFTLFIDTGFRVILWEDKRAKSALSQLSTRLLSPFIGYFIRLTVSPRSYFDADKMAAELIDNPHDLASALWKLHSYSKTLPFNSPKSIAHMFIVNPLTTARWYRYFHAQPDIKDRIKNIVGYYPI